MVVSHHTFYWYTVHLSSLIDITDHHQPSEAMAMPQEVGALLTWLLLSEVKGDELTGTHWLRWTWRCVECWRMLEVYVEEVLVLVVQVV